VDGLIEVLGCLVDVGEGLVGASRLLKDDTVRSRGDGLSELPGFGDVPAVACLRTSRAQLRQGLIFRVNVYKWA
jgi:hypothetical protein